MAIQTKAFLKTLFQDNDLPDGDDFTDLIDSTVGQVTDQQTTNLDVINESTAAAGVTIDSVLLKDNAISHDAGTNLLQTLVVPVGNWDMNFSASGTDTVNVPMDSAITSTTVRAVDVVIFDDTTAIANSLISDDGKGNWNLISDGVLTLSINAGSSFDSTNYDDSPFNRGYATVTYKVN